VTEGRAASGLAVNSGNEYGNLVSDNLLRWAREYGDRHRFDAVGGFSTTYEKGSWSGVEAQTFANDITRGANIGDATNPQKPYSGFNRSRLNSWLGRVNYTLADRYNFTATVRADGSSKFAENNKWATFPALAFAWHASDEPFLENFGTLADLKFRVSYGRSGNQAISPYQSLAAISATTMILGEAEVPAYVTSQLANPNLKWETTDQYDYGADFALWANRLSGTVDYYRKNTYDLLQQVGLPSITGYSTAWLNSGNVTNRGLELQLGYNVLTGATGGPLWNVGFNAARNRNKIESLGFGKTEQFASRLGAGGGLEATPFIQKVGYSIGTIWGYQTNGIVQTAADSAAQRALGIQSVRVGDVAYIDRNGDGTLNNDDRTKIGDANPDWTWGLTNRVTWKRVDASALVTAVRGNSIINAERMRYLSLDGSMNVPTTYVRNSWSADSNPNGRYPMIRQDRKFDARFNDLYVEDGSYVRLKNVQVGYNLGLPRARVARVYVNAINLATWTHYSGFDPEVSAFGSPDRPGVDLGSYPQQRTFTFGVNTTF
jgi:TonB-linked SusC/RagA family outer membrane protein